MTDTQQHQHHDLQTVQAHVADLHTYHRNARQGDIGAISVSLATNGQYRPIVVNRGTHTGRPMEVLAGNHTLMAARELGWPTLAAVIVDVDEHAATRIVLADNRTADLATYDERALADLLHSLDGDYAGSGFDGDDLDDIISALDGMTPPEEADSVTERVGSAYQVVVDLPDDEARGEFIERMTAEGLTARPVSL